MDDDDEFGDLYTDVLRPFAASIPSPADAPAPLRNRPIDPDVGADDQEILCGVPDFNSSISDSKCAPGIKLKSSIEETEKTLVSRPEFVRLDLNSNSNPKGSGIVGSGGLKIEATGPEKDLNLNFDDNDDNDLNIVVEDMDMNLEKAGNMFSSPELKENRDIYTNHDVADSSRQIIPGLSVKLENQAGADFEDQWDSDESEDDLQIVLNDNNHGPMGMMERMAGVDGEEDNENGEQLVIVADNGEVGYHQPVLEQEWKGEEAGPRADGERKELGDAAKAGGGPMKIVYNNPLHHHPFHSQFKYVRPGAAPLPAAVPEIPGGIQGPVRPPISMGPGAGRGRGDWRPRGPFPMQKGPQPGYGMPVWGPNTAGRGYGSGLDFTLPSHKTIFEVDIDGFEEKPWRLPGIDISDFFNFGLTEESFKDYCKQLEHLRLETTMQGKIRAYESRRTEQDYDPDLPPELAAAAAGNQDIPSENANAGNAGDGLARSITRAPPPVPIGRPIPVEISSGEERHPSIDTRRVRMHDSDTIIEIVCQSSNDGDVAEQLQSDSGGEKNVGGADDIDDHKSEIVAKREKFVSCDEIGRESDPHEMRSTKGKRRGKSSKINTSNDDDGEKHFQDNHNESSNNEDGNHTTESNKEQSVAVGDDVNDRSVDTEKEGVDIPTTDALEDEKLIKSPPNRQTAEGLHDDHLSQENVDGEEDSKASRKSSDDKSRGSVKRKTGDEDNAQKKGHHHTLGKGGKSSSHSQRGEALFNSSSLHGHMKKNENEDWPKKIRERGREDYDQDTVASKQRERDAAHNKRRKENGKREDVTYNQKESESRSRRKKERDDDINYHASQKKEESSLQKERGHTHDAWHNRNKQSREDILPRREREETRPVVRSVRPVEDKKWAGHSRGRDDYKGSGRENRSENVIRHSDQLKKRDRVDDDVFPRSRGHGKKSSTSDEHRQKEGSRKGKEFESGDHVSVMPTKTNRDEQSGQISETVKPSSLPERTDVDSDVHPNRQSSRKHARETSLDDEEQTATDSRRGRSKLERWTSHVERDFTTLPSSSKSNKAPDTNSTVGEAPSPSKKVEEDDKDVGIGGGETNNDNNVHSDTVERLKKRSERFKLPMPSEKEVSAIKKIAREPLPSAKRTESCPDSEVKIKPERPARKRRWTGK